MKSRSFGWAWIGAVVWIAAVAVSVPTAASAESIGVIPGGVDAQQVRPAVGPGAVIVTEGADTAHDMQPYAGLFVDMLSNPLVLRHDDGSVEPIVDHQMGAQAILGMGVMEHLQVEVGLPVVFVNEGEYFGQGIDGAGAGDLFGRVKGTIFSSAEAPVGLGVRLDLTVPTGNSDQYRGAPQATATPAVVADTRFETPAGEVLLATNVGVRLQGSQTVHDLDLGPALAYGAGVGLEAIPHRLQFGLDLHGGAVLSEPSRRKNPLELLAGTRVRVTDTVVVSAAGGGGLVGGVGSPQWRALAGVSYLTAEPPVSPPVVEPTEEVAEDPCPPAPEGFTGPYDEEGCPITPETFTGCDGLEDWQGAVDEWGCPLLDSDGDGFAMWQDDCPLEPVVFIGVDDDDGCPNYDVAGDGIPNVEDHCPLEPGLRIYDGCPPEEEEEAAVRGDEEIEIEKRIHFESDKAIIKEESYALLDEIALVIREESDILLVEVAGHTDARGDDDYNRMLSEERAKSVREFLIKRGGVRAARLSAEGYGSTEPLADEDTDEAHAQNRRVEFRLVEIGEEGEAYEMSYDEE